MNEKFRELMEDREFAEKLLNLDSAQEVRSLLAENGVELTLEEIEATQKLWAANLNADDGELSEDSLEDVAGGIFLHRPGFNPGIRPPLRLDDLLRRKFSNSRW